LFGLFLRDLKISGKKDKFLKVDFLLVFMKVAVLFSGGKDSCLALHLAKREGHDVEYLLNVSPDNFDSFMFHKPYPILLERQAKELGIELVVRKSKGEKEKELEDLRDLIGGVRYNVEGIVTGGIASSYQGSRIRRVCEELGLDCIAPLEGFSQEKIWESLFDYGFEVVLTKVSCDGLLKEWVGGVIDREKYLKLLSLSKKYKFRVDFEGGEAESAVLFMPGFNKRIRLDFSIRSDGEFRHYIDRLEIK